ncbi:MAG TPA: orotate phosphoribosyltransferase [Micromonosporaceae bacterium]|jgi:orotate phosphoribosyltransferase
MTGDLGARVHATALLHGSFVLRSGVTTDHYFDKYRFEADPALLREVAEAMAPLVPAGTEALAGLELGGIPLATVVGQVTGLPVRFIRKQAKAYGTAQLAEGGPVSGLQLTIIEDVVTSAGAIVAALGALRDLGATVTTAVCAIDRETGGAATLRDLGVELRSVFLASDLLP